jgi:putative transposase
VPVRQWVLSFPIPLRLLFATHPQLLAPVLQIVHRVIATFLIKQAGLKRTEAHTGAVTLMRAILGPPPTGVLRTSHFAPGKMVIQRFGSAANLNIHLHCLVLDGVYCATTEGLPVFHTVHAPTATELQALLNRIIKRIMNRMHRDVQL